MTDGEINPPTEGEIKPRKVVSFGSITCREYPVTLGDHPDCGCGPPLTIEWDHVETKSMSVDEYEEEKPRRRSLDQMVLPESYRLSLVKKCAGLSDTEIKLVVDGVKRTQKQRRMTYALLPYANTEYMFEKLGRKARKMISI